MADSSGNGRSGTYSGSPTLSATGLLAGDADTSVSFDGVNDFSSLASSSWMFVSNLTVEAWVNMDTTTGNHDIVGRRSTAGGTNESWQLRVLSGGQVDFFIVVGTTFYTTYQSVSSLSAGTTYHIVATFDGGNVRLYINGVLDATHSHAGAPNNGTGPIRIGQSGYSSPNGEWFDGRIDEVAFYSTALSGTRIAAHYAAGMGSQTVAVGQAAETDTAQTATIQQRVTVGIATETDTALTPTIISGQFLNVGQAVETDEALPATLIVGTVLTVGVAIELDSALGLVTPIALGQALETDEALAATVVLGYAESDNTNRVGGRTRSGYGVATWEPPVADPDASLIGPIQHDFEKALAFTAPTVTNGRAIAAPPTYAAAPRHRDRILVGGKDVTFYRGVHTPTPSFRLVEPGLYGAGELHMPQVHSLFEQVGSGALAFLKPGKTVRVQRVDVETGEVVAEDYVGFITGKPKSGAGSTFPLGGELVGRMALKYRPRPRFKSTADGGRLLFDAVRASSLRAYWPRLGTETGIRLARFGGMGELEYLNEAVGKLVHLNGDQWTVGLRETGFNPDAGPVGTWGNWVKDRTTIHATAYIDGDYLAPDFSDDISERPNRIFVEAVDKEGRRIDFGVAPGIKQGAAPDYPMDDESAFSQGTTDEDTDTGDGITSMVHRLVTMGYLSREDGADYAYDADTTAAIKRLQDDAGLAESGNMNVATWRALYDLDATGYTLSGAVILPAAQSPKVRLWNRTSSGALSTRNPNYDPHEIVRDRFVQMGIVKDKQQARQWARDELRDDADQEWYGTLTCHFGLIRGEHNPGDAAITSADVMSARELRPGMNVWAPLFDGGTLFHVSAIEVSAGGRNVVLTLDTEARDTMEIWQIIQRNRESRQNHARNFFGQYLSSKIGNDRLTTWNPEFGLIDDRVRLTPGWNHFEVPVGQAGTLEKIRIETNPPTEFVASVSAREISDARMAHLVPNPLSEAGTERWETPWVRDALESRVWLDSWGEYNQPAGYSPRKKTTDNNEPTGAPLTGVLEDASPLGFHTFSEPVLYVAIYVTEACTVKAGRIMWIQMEGSA